MALEQYKLSAALFVGVLLSGELLNGSTVGAVDTGPLPGLHGLAYAGGKIWFAAQEARVRPRPNPSKWVQTVVPTVQGDEGSRRHLD
jgi:hypothetical protein